MGAGWGVRSAPAAGGLRRGEGGGLRVSSVGEAELSAGSLAASTVSFPFKTPKTWLDVDGIYSASRGEHLVRSVTSSWRTSSSISSSARVRQCGCRRLEGSGLCLTAHCDQQVAETEFSVDKLRRCLPSSLNVGRSEQSAKHFELAVFSLQG